MPVSLPAEIYFSKIMLPMPVSLPAKIYFYDNPHPFGFLGLPATRLQFNVDTQDSHMRVTGNELAGGSFAGGDHFR